MIQILPENKEKCCGCAACVQVCPQACIIMKEDEEGFLYPRIDEEKCIHCNLCEKVCPVVRKGDYYDKGQNPYPKTVGGWHKNEEVRYDSSSGGAFTLLAEYIIAESGIVYGCTLREDFRAEHIGVERMEDLCRLRGSKYIQSDINDVYRKVREELDKGRKVLFIGTPCQCAGLHSFLKAFDISGNKNKYDDLYVCDFICHGVPSVKVFKSYVVWLENKYKDKLISFRFRNKDKGWSSIGQMGTEAGFLRGGNRRFAPVFRDAYMNGFLDDLYLRPSCYDCEFKDLPKYYSDITIADFWGVKKVDVELYDGKGTSLVMIHNRHGQELFDLVKNNFFYKEVDFKAAIRRNKSLVKSAVPNPHRGSFFFDYENVGFKRVVRKYMNAFSWAGHKMMKVLWNCIERMIRLIWAPVLHLVHQSWDEAKWESFFQFIRFSMVGVSNVAVAYTINVSMLFLLRHMELSFDYMIANVTAFALSVLWSYHWNSSYVFHPDRKEKGWQIKTLLKTYVSYAFAGIILNNVLSTIWIRVLGISKFISPLLNLPFSIPVNFFMQKLWAYKEKETDHGK